MDASVSEYIWILLRVINILQSVTLRIGLYRVRAKVLAVQKEKKISSSRIDVESSAEASVDVEQEVNHAAARYVLLILFYLYSE